MTTNTPAPAMQEAVLTDDNVKLDINGATWLGMRVAGWTWDEDAFSPDQFPSENTMRHYASHWSTGPHNAERLYRESDIIALLSKLRAPVADGSLAAQALKSAQSNIAAYRPPGSSDPESSQYDHDAFMWDYYQRAIDSLALASAPVAGEAIQKAKHDTCHAETEPERVTALAYWLDQQTFEPGMLSIAAATLRAMLSRDAAPQPGPVAGEAVTYLGNSVAERLESMADDQPPGSQAQSDLYAAATIWRKHIGHHAAPQASEAVRDAPTACDSEVMREAAWHACRKDVGTGGWTVAEAFHYRGFFMHGWRAALSAQPGAQKGGSDVE